MARSPLTPPKVSVIIAAHNEEQYIGRTLAAVTALQYPDFEVIVVDNASTDGTAEVVRNFVQAKLGSDPNITFIQESRKGVQFAREAGRQAATGDIIAFVDAVCLPSPDWLTRVTNDLSNNFIAVSGPYYYYDHGKIFGWMTLVFQKIGYKLAHEVLQFLHHGGTMVFGNCAATKEALISIGGINTNIEFYGDDTDLAKKLTSVGPIKYDSSLVMKRSARRFKNIGTLKTIAIYWWYFVKTIFSTKS